MREIETERLKLRFLKADDAQTIFDNWASDPEVPRYMTWNVHTSVGTTKAVVNEWLTHYGEPGCYRWGIELKETGELIGMIDVVEYEENNVPQIGYCSGRRWWNNGYMTEALIAVTAELFNDGFGELYIRAVRENIGSNRVIQKAGFEFTGTLEGPQSEAKPHIVTVNTYRLYSPKERTEI